MTKVDAAAALAALLDSPLELEHNRDLAAPAFELSVLIPCTVYDGVYVALALRESAVLITADTRLSNSCRNHGLGDHVMALEEAVRVLAT